MRLALFWSEILHYHAARIRALCDEAEASGHTVYPFALRRAAPNLPVSGYHDLLRDRITVLGAVGENAGPYTKQSQAQIVAFLDQRQPDAVGIAGYDSPVSLAALSWCRRYRRGAILMSESKADDYARSYVKEQLKRLIVSCFDAALVGGTPQVAYVRRLGMSPDSIFVGYDAVDNEFWSSRAAAVRSQIETWRNRLALPPNYFLTACRLVPKKNVAGLLRAYALYTQRARQVWPLMIAGDGRLRDDLQRLALQLDIAQHVRFLGYLDAEALAPYYALASVFILASHASEQWGLVVNEAMAAGLPVLVSKACGSSADLVVEGQTGFTFDPNDEPTLAGLLAACARGDFDLARMGLEAQARIERCSPKVFAKNFIAAAHIAVSKAQARATNHPCRLILDAARRLVFEPATTLE